MNFETFVTKNEQVKNSWQNEATWELSLSTIDEAGAAIDGENIWVDEDNDDDDLDDFYRGLPVNLGKVEYRAHYLNQVNRKDYADFISGADILFGGELVDTPIETERVSYMLHMYKGQIVALAKYVRPHPGMNVTVLYYTRSTTEM